MMGELDNHFGDNAPPDPATAEKITKEFYVANAGDAGGQRYSSKLLKGVATGAAPQRITELPKWVSEHRKGPTGSGRHKEDAPKRTVSPAIPAAEQGYYEELRTRHFPEQEDFTMRPLTITALIATVFFSISSHAQDVRSANTDKVKWLSIPEVHQIGNLLAIEISRNNNVERGSYEVKATDQAGRRIKL